jgi:cation:H+ antiporter
MPPALLWLQLAASAAVILGASQFLTKSADIIAEKTGLGRSFIGVVLLATATSMPEMGTGISSILLFGEPDLAAGDAFGSNMVNLAIIGLLDFYWRNGPILNAVSKTSLLIAGLGIAITAVTIVAILIHGATSSLSAWYVSPFSVVMVVMFVGAMFLIYRHDRAEAQVPSTDMPTARYSDARLSRAALSYVASTGAVVGAAIWLSQTGDGLADAMGWETSFVGTQFLAISTSLPELATSFAAIRLNAPELAISNLLGSNLFNHGFVLFLDDMVYTEGVLWQGISQVHLLTAVFVIFMTGVAAVGILARQRRRSGKYWTPEGLALLGLYIAASILVFRLA